MVSRPTFNKRQKEHARKEKQRLKVERKLQRKLEKNAASDGVNSADQTGEPQSS